jgi:hypothetical protein
LLWTVQASLEESKTEVHAATSVEHGVETKIFTGLEAGTVPFGAYGFASHGIPCIVKADLITCRLGSKSLERQTVLQTTGGTGSQISWKGL